MTANLTVSDIIGGLVAVAQARGLGLTAAELKGPSRRAFLQEVRLCGYWLARAHLPEKSLPQIGRAFGGRDHSTIMSGIERVERDFGQYLPLIEAVEKRFELEPVRHPLHIGAVKAAWIWGLL